MLSNISDNDDPTDPVETIRAELAALREELREEIRTRRVVVVDAEGRERVVLSTGPGFGSIRVDTIDGDPGTELYAVDAIEADGPEVGLAIVVDGDVVQSFRLLTARDRRPPAL